ncbi:MAG: hypothetical protein AAFV53_11460 [Myxococcota bacterium]
MGFFDAIKSIGRAITGGGAKVHVDIGQATVNQPIQVRVKVQVADADIDISNVYLLVQAHEEVRIDNNGLTLSLGERVRDLLADGYINGITHRYQTADFRVNISGPTTLKANESYTFDGTVQLPAGARPSYNGQTCDHVWTIQAGLDAFGNDPDSGWINFIVR